eukprot:6484381-Amphidinium_carterae.1
MGMLIGAGPLPSFGGKAAETKASVPILLEVFKHFMDADGELHCQTCLLVNSSAYVDRVIDRSKGQGCLPALAATNVGCRLQFGSTTNTKLPFAIPCMQLVSHFSILQLKLMCSAMWPLIVSGKVHPRKGWTCKGENFQDKMKKSVQRNQIAAKGTTIVTKTMHKYLLGLEASCCLITMCALII